MDNTFSRALDPLYRVCIWVSGLAIAVMSLIIPWGVFARYVLGSGSSWPEPIAIVLMVIFTFLGGAAAYRAGAHIAVQMFTDSLPPPLRKVAAFASDLVMLAVSGFILVWGTKLCIGTWGQSLDTLPWMPVGLTYAALPLGSLLTALFVLERMVVGSQSQRPLVAYGEHGSDLESEAK
jgi:TRAP-type C4-dicarboxylate transport system permease small subunit